MEIDKVFSSDVDGVADNLFSAVKNSVSEIKAMQQRKAAENVQLVIQALKKIESDLQDKFDGVTTVIEKRVATIKDGRDGLDGRNGRDGKDGRPGRDGAPGARGPAGVPGTNGRDGEDGVSVTDARIDFDGSLIISLSSGREINVGEVVAPDLAEKIKVITNGGGTSQSVLDTLASLQAQITAISSLGAVNYRGTWNASSNSPIITSGNGTKGYYYVVSVAGSTNIDGQTLWGVGDWIIFNGTVWQKVDGGSTGDFTTLSASGTVTFTGLNASQAVFTNGSDELVSNAITGTGNVVMSASPTLTGTASLAALTTSSTVTHNGGAANGVAYLNGSKVLTTGSALTYNGTTLTADTASTSAANFRIENGSFNRVGAFQLTANGVQFDAFDQNSTSAQRSFMWLSGGSEQMRLTSTGLGIGTSSPAYKLDVVGTAAISGGVTLSGGTANGVAYLNGSKVLTTGSALTFDGTTLTASASASATGNFKTTSNSAQVFNLTASNDANTTIGLGVFGSAAGSFGTLSAGTPFLSTAAATMVQNVQNASGAFVWGIGSTPSERMRLDSSGNLGLGVTPSAWGANGKPLQTGNASFWGLVGTATFSSVGANYFYDGSYKYISNGVASDYYQLSGAHVWRTAASGTAGAAISFTQAMTLDASGNLGVGSTSISPAYGYSKVIEVAGSFPGIKFAPSGASTFGFQIGAGTGGFQFYDVTAAAERARIDSSGNLLVGTTTAYGVGGLTTAPGGTAAAILSWNKTNTGNEYAAQFRYSGTIVGSIEYSSTATSYVTTSDYRLKEDVQPMTGALAKVAALKPCTYKWKSDGSAGEGFIAHELAEVVPQCVTGEKDAVDAKGNPVYQGIDTSFLVATLTAAIQELKAEFDAYKATHP